MCNNSAQNVKYLAKGCYTRIMNNLMTLLYEKQAIEKELSDLFYGTIQIREKNGRKYIYVYRREAGVLRAKYCGEESDSLKEKIKQDNALAKELKQRLKEIDRELTKLGYVKADGFSDRVLINAAIAKRELVNSVYNQSILEGIATTYSETEELINEGQVRNMNADDVQKIINLKRSWTFVTDTDIISYPTNYALLCQINDLVETNLDMTPGKIRSTPVRIGGSSYIPPMPIESQVKERLNEIIDKPVSVDVAIELILFVMKSQLFIDGNKRTAVVFGNHYLIRHGLGLLVIPAELTSEYKKRLVAYYEGRDEEDIRLFLKEKCWYQI